MTKEKKQIPKNLVIGKVNHEPVRWSNSIVDTPVVYGLIERRTLYFITGEVKHKYVEKNLGVPDNWKDLYFHLTDEDLGVIGGEKNVPRTYEALCKLGQKFLPVSFRNEKGELVIGKVHWIDTFFYNEVTKMYDVRVSPEIMPYLIDISQSFTTFDLGTAMLLRSKYTQKMYELCSQFSGDFRYVDSDVEQTGNVYKKRVLPIAMDKFRRIFNLDEVRDARTNRVITPATYVNFKNMRTNILDVAQSELYSLYLCHHSNVWFDYQPGPKKGRGGKVSSVYIFIYTRDFPKNGIDRPWQDGDEPLSPFEKFALPIPKVSPQQRIRENLWYDLPDDTQERAVEALLSHYMTADELKYYMRQITAVARNHKDSWVQVIQVIKDKERQPKFQEGTDAFKHKCITEFALKKNLQVFGWSLEPMPKVRRTKKTTLEQDLFRE